MTIILKKRQNGVLYTASFNTRVLISP